jgi:hypothetical protein
MKNKKVLIILAWAIALVLVVVGYLRATKKPMTGPYPLVLVPPQPNPPAKGKTLQQLEIERKERELEQKQIEELKASLDRANKSGSVSKAQPIP